MKQACSGWYHIQNPDKYFGGKEEAPLEIKFKSTWEKFMMLYCDKSKEVIEWEYEPYSEKQGQFGYRSEINYKDIDNKQHRYIPDFYLRVRQLDVPYIDFIVEVKPKQQTVEPKPGSKQALFTLFEKNKRKWAAAKKWCKKHDMEFDKVTEDNLKSFKFRE